MSESQDKLDREKLQKVRKDPDHTRYTINFKHMEIVLTKSEYCDLITARNLLKKDMAVERGLSDSAEVPDKDFYKYILTRSCRGICADAHHRYMQHISQRALEKLIGGGDPDQHRGHGCDQDPDNEENEDAD